MGITVIGKTDKDIFRAMRRCVALRESIINATPDPKVAMQSTRASSCGVRHALQSTPDNKLKAHIAHSGALGGLANSPSFLRTVIAMNASYVVLPNKNRGGRLAEPAFSLLMHLLGIGIGYSHTKQGISAGLRENTTWWKQETLCLQACVIHSRVGRPLGGIGIGFNSQGVSRWLCANRADAAVAPIVLRPGRNIPPIACALIAGLAFDCPVGIGEWCESGALLVVGGRGSALSEQAILPYISSRACRLLICAEKAERRNRRVPSIKARLALFAERRQASKHSA